MVAKRDFAIVRGDSFELDVALAQGFDDVMSQPELYVARLCLRLEQDDSLPILLEITSSGDLELEDPCRGEGARVYFTFKATPEITADLPPYDLVHYVEIASLDGAFTQRLFEGKVRIRD